MSFRETSGWISLGSIVVFYGYYFLTVARAAAAGEAATFPFGRLLTGVIVLLMVTEIVLHIAVAIASPKEAQAREDERERLIELRSTHAAFFVAMVGTAFGAAAAAFGLGRFYTANGLLLAMVLAELVHFGGRVAQYRRSA